MRFITDTISIYAYKLVSDGEIPKIRDTTALYTNVPCSIQPAGNEIFTLFPDGIEAAQAFVIYIMQEGVKIKNGYKIVDQLGNSYIVRGIPEMWATANSRLNHIRVAAEKQVEY